MKQFYLVFILIFGLQLSFGQVTFEQLSVYDVSSRLDSFNGVDSGDIDNDGDLDIVAASFSPNQIVWYENLDGLGSFGINNFITVNAVSSDVISVFDINGDGNIDVLTNKAWFENLDGLGNFGTENVFTSIDSNSISAEDFDNDGDLDIFNSTVWFENTDGLGNFIERQTFVSGSVVSYIDISISGDIDNDGDMDIVTSLFNQNVIVWYENLDGLGNFDVAKTIATTNEPRYIALGDFDDDDNLDVVSLNSNDGKLRYHRNLGNGAAWNASTLYTNTASNYRSLNVADIDNDGDIDISIALDSYKYRWFENDGNGVFQQQVTPSDAQELGINADIDGDNDLDLIAVNFCTQSLEWHPFPYTSQSNPYKVDISRKVGEISTVYMEDIDSDGDLDVISDGHISCNYSSNPLRWFENVNGYINPILEKNISTSLGDNLQFGDIDSDGDVDYLSLSKSANKIFIYLNNNNGQSFQPNGNIQVNYPSSFTSTETFELKDLNSDGSLDLVTFINNETVWLSNTNAVFSNPTTISSSLYWHLESFDFDNDFDNDIFFVSGSTIGWFENQDGLGLFSGEALIDQVSIDLFDISDVDNDSDFDIIAFSSQDNSIIFYENLGMGSFSNQQVIFQDFLTNVNQSVSSLKMSDMNQDGLKDIIVALDNGLPGVNNYKVFWYENLGTDLGFSQKQGISSLRSEGIIVKDFDNDGDNDVLSLYESGDFIGMFKNLGVLGNEINGTVTFDCGNSDIPLSNILINSTNSTDNFSTFSNTSSYYQQSVNQGDFTTQILNLPSYFAYDPISQTTNITGVGNTETIDFCIEPTGIFNDLNITIYPSLNEPRPGFHTTYQLVCKNVGATQLSGSVSFEFDDAKLQFLSASETVTSQTANTLSFDFTDLNPFETRIIDLEFNVFAPPITNIDDVLVSTATINPITGDETEEDNTFELNQTVIGSYDPNDITVLEGDEIFIEDADKFLHYLIRFQNTGTASAINVNVEHVLDDNLDWTTMQLESLSHTGRVEIENQTDVSFIFNNINLPDSTNDEPNSHGFIAFKIKPKSNVQVGDIISGVADIYFDFNPPIITNTVNTEIAEPLSIDEVSAETIKLYPNPAKDTIQITSNQVIEALTVFDINGRELQSLEISTTDYNLDISNLSKGVYFIELLSGESKFIEKFIKN
ncbi:T9SS type A sorting domain-containing protein [Winogradskyella sp.]|uniref:T9SS type A sorting domain-containing protein n=1 Tax=Winogradskyella sp. TaxID=1883156 RepID=UPI003AA8A258